MDSGRTRLDDAGAANMMPEPPLFDRTHMTVRKQAAARRPPRVGRTADDMPAQDPKESESGDIATIVSRNLKDLRLRRGFSMEALAALAGVSRGMLSQIELGRSVPTIGLLWKVARALGVSFAALTSDAASSGTTILRADKARLLTSANGVFTSRALFPYPSERRVEFYKLTLAPNAEEIADPHPPGTLENLTVASGSVEIMTGGVSYLLKTDDAIFFEADAPHKYRNTGAKTAILYLVMSYVGTTG